jgi:hypothetical protein
MAKITEFTLFTDFTMAKKRKAENWESGNRMAESKTEKLATEKRGQNMGIYGIYTFYIFYRHDYAEPNGGMAVRPGRPAGRPYRVQVKSDGQRTGKNCLVIRADPA